MTYTIARLRRLPLSSSPYTMWRGRCVGVAALCPYVASSVAIYRTTEPHDLWFMTRVLQEGQFIWGSTGKIRIQTFLDAILLAKEKLLNNAGQAVEQVA